MDVSQVRAVLFAKDLERVAAFYAGALGMVRTVGDKDHAVLKCDGFELVVHQIPKHIADTIEIEHPPERRTTGAIRLDYPVSSVAGSRRLARSLGGDIDEVPPPWAERGANFYFGHDPEGNRFGVSGRERG
jgi:catechol 2,3-dioxygenase-like lactoylglutathione lyase family enzyme